MATKTVEQMEALGKVLEEQHGRTTTVACARRSVGR